MLNFKKVRNDIILAAVLLTLTAAGFLVLFLTGKNGDYVTVLINNKAAAHYSLSEDIELTVSGEQENTYNILVIKNGKAYIKSASCPDKICVHHRAISKENETIVCLPNKLVIEVRKRSSKNSDIIA